MLWHLEKLGVQLEALVHLSRPNVSPARKIFSTWCRRLHSHPTCSHRFAAGLVPQTPSMLAFPSFAGILVPTFQCIELRHGGSMWRQPVKDDELCFLQSRLLANSQLPYAIPTTL